MATSVDIAVILDRTSSTAFFHPTINSIVNHILGRATSVDGNDVRLASVEFQSHHDLLNVRTHPFTSATADTFAGWMSTPFVQGNGSPEHKAIDDAMSEALALQWRHHTKTSNLFHENLLILFTDGPPCGLRNEECSHQHRNLWKQAKKLLKKDITLVVVGIEPSILICDDFYCALASKTGGLYIPLINAARVLSTVMVYVMTTEQTFFQLFWRRNILENLEADSLFSYRAVEPRARSMIEHYRTMTAIRRSFYTYRERPASYFEVTSISIDVDARRSSWPLSPECLERSSYPSIEVTTSTPMTNDDGYHSRLPTTASDVCTPSQLDSPSEELHLNADTDTDDDDVFGCGPFIC